MSPKMQHDPRTLCDRLLLAFRQRALAEQMATDSQNADRIAGNYFRYSIHSFMNRPEGRALRQHIQDITLLVETETREIQIHRPSTTIKHNGTG